jgi:hypothetical protein
MKESTRTGSAILGSSSPGSFHLTGIGHAEQAADRHEQVQRLLAPKSLTNLLEQFGCLRILGRVASMPGNG